MSALLLLRLLVCLGNKPLPPFRTMIALIRPVLMSFLGSDKVKRLIVDMLRKLAEQSDNTVDDQAVDFIERGLFGG